MKYKKNVTLIFIVVLLILYYLISPLFKNIILNEASPEGIQSKATSSIIIGYAGHYATGTLKIITSENKRYIRYENFKTINGPDLYVYLSKDVEAKDYIDLGRIKATEGNINYEIPKDIDLKQYHYVMTWCKKFGVLFNYVDLN